MKNYLILAVAFLFSCESSDGLDYIRTCDNSTVYKRHEYVLDGTFFHFTTEKCKYCGLKRFFYKDVKSPDHFGFVYKYMPPKSHNYSDCVVECNNNGETVYIKVDENTLVDIE